MSSTTNCPACGCKYAHPIDREFDFGGQHFVLKSCVLCASIFYDPLPSMDYSTHTANTYSVRDYVELNASIDTLGKFIFEAIGDKSKGRLLDVGCGYGFAADIARRLKGWDVTGVEPSTYGTIGATNLGIRILHEYIDENHPIAKEKFDIITASEVLEHIHDPRKFMVFLKSLLADDGVISVTVPSDTAARSTSLSESARLAVLSPGSHTVLFSRPGLEGVFKRAGLENVEIAMQGSSYVVRASNAPLPKFTSASGLEIGIEYTRRVLEDGVVDPSLRAGMNARLYRYLVDLGRYAEAEPYLDALGTKTVHDLSDVKTWSEFLEIYRSFAPTAFYYHGVLEMNFRGNFERAASLFKTAYDLCAWKVRNVPFAAVVESDLIWLAIYHAGLAKIYAGQLGEGVAILHQLGRRPQSDLPAVPEFLIVQANEKIQAHRATH
jgi:SAM-dependent methyltransferase